MGKPSAEKVAVAAHELGHAYAWKAYGLSIVEIKVSGWGAPYVHVRWWPSRPGHALAYAVGCMAGFEAEDRWLREQNGKRANRTRCRDDRNDFRAVVKEMRLGLSESKAHSLARDLVNQHWDAIAALAPTLAAKGHISPSRL